MNILGIWDGHDSGAALLQDGRLRFAVNEERLTPPQARDRVSRSRSIARVPGARRPAPGARSTSSRPRRPIPPRRSAAVWPGSKERYYAVRRRKAPPGPLAGLTRAVEVPDHRVGARAGLDGRSAGRAAAAARAARARARRRSGSSIITRRTPPAAAWASGFAPCAVLTIDGLGDGLSATISAFRDGRLERVAASPARSSLGVFFEHVTNLLNMRELEDEGKVMALADYAAPIADDDNPLLPLVRVRDGVIETARPGPRAAAGAGARSTGGIANEQFAYLAQRVVEHACVALARDAVRLTGLRAARAGRRRRVEREGDAARPPAAGGRGRLRVSAHGRRRAGARRRRRRARPRGRADRPRSRSSRSRARLRSRGDRSALCEPRACSRERVAEPRRAASPTCSPTGGS